MAQTNQLQFGNLIDLANRDFGGNVLAASLKPNHELPINPLLSNWVDPSTEKNGTIG